MAAVAAAFGFFGLLATGFSVPPSTDFRFFFLADAAGLSTSGDSTDPAGSAVAEVAEVAAAKTKAAGDGRDTVECSGVAPTSTGMGTGSSSSTEGRGGGEVAHMVM